MKELVVLSGKGGTGKTSVVSSFAALAAAAANPGATADTAPADGGEGATRANEAAAHVHPGAAAAVIPSAVFADCDVDAADLHIILEPTVREEGAFSGGRLATVRAADCTACGLCSRLCAVDAITQPAGEPAVIDSVACEGCGVCAHFCPVGAIDFEPVENGRWYVSETRFGPMAHARLGIAEENSGKLAALVREKAAELARERGSELIITDGPPGVGCPVISSVTGADLILVVTEPTRSGLHDLDRVLELAEHFAIPALVAINKADLNRELAAEIERRAGAQRVAARIPYDRDVTAAQVRKLSVVEYAAATGSPGDSGGGAAEAIRGLWDAVARRVGQVPVS